MKTRIKLKLSAKKVKQDKIRLELKLKINEIRDDLVRHDLAELLPHLNIMRMHLVLNKFIMLLNAESDEEFDNTLLSDWQ